jgi:hypothetical protein
MNIPHPLKFIREALSDEDGLASWSRIASSAILVVSLVWVTKIVLLTHQIPSLDGVITMICAPYTINLAHGFASNAFAIKSGNTNASK